MEVSAPSPTRVLDGALSDLSTRRGGASAGWVTGVFTAARIEEVGRRTSLGGLLTRPVEGRLLLIGVLL